MTIGMYFPRKDAPVRSDADTGLDSSSVFRLIETTQIHGFQDRETHGCFRGPAYGFRDKDYDPFLPFYQRKSSACVISTISFTENSNFEERMKAILGITGSCHIMSNRLQKLILDIGCTLSLTQVEEMIKTIMRKTPNEKKDTIIYDYSFLVRGARSDVFVGRVNYEKQLWHSHIYRVSSVLMQKHLISGDMFIRNLRKV
ncbi:MAG: hypothetical protein COX06_03315 [Candidatus Zambryskibacteria bacterium CG22_combo_CG10-13_8_21_14_all_42_17]|uniref:Uncharacterized protein n=1 Tax=Candidatus Zambryskibacteria bacterium CG22_combo_CG10-13_8_21_14_all_42_17 TaxID=1975118 RepID=A0A2H0BCM1_9BACT|nr:MAG: hypothetical protein COX06_03315 [Candidatus Zambryskibacteria bacterium CG22_combo_CG10-13_8_21_14_all_42_17]